MTPRGMPAGLRARLVRVEDPLLVGRYRAALERICGRGSALDAFHVDAAGYSPEIAEELGDPFYLGQGPDHPFFLLLGVAQLSACLLQPNAGFGAHAFRAFAHAQRGELADLTLREAVFGELSHGKTALTRPDELGLVRELSVELDTVSGRIQTARSLSAMREELLASDALWHDETFLETVREKSRRVHGYLPPRGGAAETRRVEAGAAFVPRFGGTYVFPGRGPGAAERVWVMPAGAAEPACVKLEGGREVVVRSLAMDTALDVLAEQGWIELAPTGAQMDLPMLEALQTWLALDFLRRTGDLPDAGDVDPGKLRRRMRQREDAPPDFLELEEVRMKAARPADWVELARYSPITRLRMLALRTPDADRCAIVRHMQAFLDPVNVPRAYRDAPDLFWARRGEMDAAMLDLIPRWIDPAEELNARCR